MNYKVLVICNKRTIFEKLRAVDHQEIAILIFSTFLIGNLKTLCLSQCCDMQTTIKRITTIPYVYICEYDYHVSTAV